MDDPNDIQDEQAETASNEGAQDEPSVDSEPELKGDAAETQPGDAAAEEVETPGVEGQAVEENAPETPAEPAAPESDMQWYIIHTYSGFEQKVADSLTRARTGVRICGSDRPGSHSH